MQKINGPFRLIHMDGRKYDCATIEDVFEKIAGYAHWTRYDDLLTECRVGDRPFYRSQSASPYKETFERIFNKHVWIVQDEVGVVSLFALGKMFRIALGVARKKWLYRWRSIPRDEISTDWSVFRGLDCWHGSKRRRYSVHRGMRTMQEIREQERVCEELAEVGIKARPRRDLPTRWDDRRRSNYGVKNWKQYRRTQYRG